MTRHFGHFRRATTANVLTVAAIAGLALCAGCVVVGGSNTRASPTLGQQLIDLRRALDDGAIDATQYDELRSKLVKGELKPS